MTFTKAFPTSLTNDVSVVTAAQLNQIDLNQSRAVDGTGGGSYTPGGDIKITGPNSIELQGTTQLKYQSRNLARRFPIVYTSTTGTWLYTDNRAQNTATGYIDVPLHHLPHGQTLDYVLIAYQGNGGHANDPVNGGGGGAGTGIDMPHFKLYKQNQAGTLTLIGAQTDDTVVTRALYEAYHTWTNAGAFGEVLDLVNYEYFVRITSEFGTDYVAGAFALAIVIQFDVTSQNEV